MTTDIEIQPTEVKSEPIVETYPSVEKLRIIYAAKKITDNTDPMLSAVYGYSAKVFCMSYFTQTNGEVGTAFFCQMKDDWVAPTEEQAKENVKKLDDL